MVSNTGSDYDENEAEFEADDGSDDWKPAEVSFEILFECVCVNGGIAEKWEALN